METISAFAKDIGNRKPIIGVDEECKIVRQFLCTMVPQIPFSKVFHHVSSGDLSRIEFRAPNQLKKWQDCMELAPGDLSIILKDSDPKQVFKGTIVGKHFIETVEPPQGLELVAFFISGQADKNMHHLIDAELTLDKDKDRDMFGVLKAYNIRDCGLSDNEIYEELGTIISTLTFPFLNTETITLLEPIEDDKEKDENVAKNVDEPQFKFKESVNTTKEWTAQHERDLRSNPIIMAFKKENNLSTQFPAVKAAKQLVASTISSSSDLNVPKHVLGKRQTSIKPLKLDPDTHTVQHWNHIIDSLIDYHVEDERRTTYLATSDLARDYYDYTRNKNKNKNTDLVTEHEFLKSMIMEHLPVEKEKELEKCARYLKKYDQGMVDISKLLF